MSTHSGSDQPVWPEMLRGRELYHIAPLHYVPSILQDGALYAKSVLRAKEVSPRATARRRDAMLGLSDFVHFAFEPATPLLSDKLAKGYPHAVLGFDAAALAGLPEHSLLPYNTKAWRTRAAYELVTEEIEKTRLLRRHDEFGDLPSLEFLVKYGVGLDMLTSVAFITEAEQDDVLSLCAALQIDLPAPARVDNSLAPKSGYVPSTAHAIRTYFPACRAAGAVLPPPREIPFD